MNPAPIDHLHADLTAARYRVDVLDGIWGSSAAAALFRGQTLPARRELERRLAVPADGERPVPRPVETLARLFVLGDSVTVADLRGALPATGVQGALELGIVGIVDGDAELGGGAFGDDSRVRALLDLRPYSFVDSLGAGSWWIVSDLGEGALGRALDEDHVLGVGGASMTLSGLMIASPVDSVLDLGTGCGIQALHAARFARRVVATDISRRALALAEFNARLNRVESIEFRHGSLFEPVAGEQFDRIVSNPPFVITPRVDGVPLYEYRDGGLVGDGLVESVVRQLGAHLRPGGIAQLLGNWEYRDAVPASASAGTAAAPGSDAAASGPASGAVGRQDGLERVRSWVPRSGEHALDVWVIERERQDAPTYAETWIRDGGTRPGTPAFDALYAAWLDDFRDRGVTEVGFGYLLFRRPAAGAPTLARYERLDEGLGSNPVGLGDHVAACLDGHDWSVRHDDEALLRATLVYASDITEERHFWPGQEDPVVMTLRQGGGFGRSVSLDTGLAAFIGTCDGDLSVRAICGALAEVLAVDEAALTAELLPSIRSLLADAILLPA
ncbi:methyltransferase [Herbiconiux sp.]|uniref:DUF7059 domain-containing protein n=1 Tax=Herbiconiux sp. TaxID=1871186 RepID=UPI0025C3846C|nr:methyltransferase [Herbiconiux sp.]